MNGVAAAAEAVAATFREEWGRIVSTLIRLTGDWDLAEECAQEALAQAVARWPRDGVPAARERGSPPRRATTR
ncbi:hypothetical protein GCM10009610_39310 [Pseudonocardia xinjiangensis]